MNKRKLLVNAINLSVSILTILFSTQSFATSAQKESVVKCEYSNKAVQIEIFKDGENYSAVYIRDKRFPGSASEPDTYVFPRCKFIHTAASQYPVGFCEDDGTFSGFLTNEENPQPVLNYNLLKFESQISFTMTKNREGMALSNSWVVSHDFFDSKQERSNADLSIDTTDPFSPSFKFNAMDCSI